MNAITVTIYDKLFVTYWTAFSRLPFTRSKNSIVLVSVKRIEKARCNRLNSFHVMRYQKLSQLAGVRFWRCFLLPSWCVCLSWCCFLLWSLLQMAKINEIVRCLWREDGLQRQIPFGLSVINFFCRKFNYEVLFQQLLYLVIYDCEAFFSLERLLGRLHSFERNVIIATFGGSILIPRHFYLDSSIHQCSWIRQRFDELVFS